MDTTDIDPTAPPWENRCTSHVFETDARLHAAFCAFHFPIPPRIPPLFSSMPSMPVPYFIISVLSHLATSSPPFGKTTLMGSWLQHRQIAKILLLDEPPLRSATMKVANSLTCLTCSWSYHIARYHRMSCRQCGEKAKRRQRRRSRDVCKRKLMRGGKALPYNTCNSWRHVQVFDKLK